MEDPRRRKMRRIEGDGRVRFLTFSTYRRLPLFSNGAIKDRFARTLADERLRGGFHLFAWVVMPEHVHLLVWPRERLVTDILRRLKSSFARECLRVWRSREAPILHRIIDDSGVPRFWQRGGGFDRNVCDMDELGETIWYIHLNPVRRGLVENPEDWVWSSARWYAGERDETIPIDPLG